MKTTYKFFQVDGTDATLVAATRKWESENPGRRVTEAKIECDIPVLDREGRWIDISIVHEMDRTYAYAD